MSFREVCRNAIRREVELVDGLELQLGLARGAAEAAPLVAGAGAAALAASLTGGIPVFSAAAALMVKHALPAVLDSSDAFESIRQLKLKLDKTFAGGDAPAHACCGTALAYAHLERWDDANRWLLRKPVRDKSDLARPYFIRGLIVGARGDHPKSIASIERALAGRAYPRNKERMRSVLDEVRAAG